MARKLRVEYAGAIYHVMNRGGGRREPIFKTDQDRLLFLDTLAAACRKRGGWDSRILKEWRKGDPQKLKLALQLRRETTMTLNWIAQRLNMGTAGSLANLPRHAKGKQ